MKITQSVRKAVQDALNAKGLERQELAARIGVSKSWVSKFFAGHVKNLQDEQAAAIERELSLTFYRVTEAPRTQSQLAADFARMIDKCPRIAAIAAAVIDLVEHK